ncbi:chymotrypsin-1-like [Haematobia irritans]|uniref:chymotrypsin-1-like n=1 Tax=Haematobia irritans TaxID=7368 RepID=UPI003F505B46
MGATKISNIFLILIFLIVFYKSDGQVQRIVGGFSAKESQFPYVVSIRRLGDHICGGVIISRNFILTAGRCVVKNFSNDGVTSYPAHEFNIRVGSLSLYDKGLLWKISEIMVHSNYTNMLNDLALLKLQEPLVFSDYIQPIEVSYERPSLKASEISIAGWGFQKTSGYVSRYLQYITMDVVEPSNCMSHLLGDEAEKSLLCLQFNGGGICTGDIGAAAIYHGELVGLASFSLEKCGNEYPDGFTNIAYYRQWILQNTDLI